MLLYVLAALVLLLWVVGVATGPAVGAFHLLLLLAVLFAAVGYRRQHRAA